MLWLAGYPLRAATLMHSPDCSLDYLLSRLGSA